MFPDNKAVQPCLARQTDIRPAISFGSPAVLTKFAEHKKNRPVKRAKRLPAKGRGQGPLTGHPGHDRAATPVSKL